MPSKIERKIESSCRKALYDFKLVDDCPKIAVALSGGKDSLTLLYILKSISGRGFPPFNIEAIHIAGEFTCGAGVDQAFLQKITDELEIPLHIVETKHQASECYSCSRDRRNHLFAKAKEIGASTIAFGHHRDDSVQTLLMNLLHKGEFVANLPKIYMHHYNVTIIRPLIFVSEDEIITFAQQKAFLRITCQCPIGQNSMRKKVKNLLEEIERLYPHARANLASAGLVYGSPKAAEP